ncbi:MAG: CvpA family protein [Planctomycetota bacterium]|jgi:uncharacterized membrane protein required for colicin V production
MVFWLGILAGGLLAWYAIRIGFYEMWAMLFNIVISIYLAVFLGPAALEVIPGVADTPYSNVLAMLTIAAGAFLILHCISYTLITGQFSVTFPRIFNSLGTGLLGFLAGFLVWSFASLLIYMTPVSQNKFVREIGFGSQFQQSNVSFVCWWCDLVNKVVASQDGRISSEKAISELLESRTQEMPDKMGDTPEPNEPADSDPENT